MAPGTGEIPPISVKAIGGGNVHEEIDVVQAGLFDALFGSQMSSICQRFILTHFGKLWFSAIVGAPYGPYGEIPTFRLADR